MNLDKKSYPYYIEQVSLVPERLAIKDTRKGLDRALNIKERVSHIVSSSIANETNDQTRSTIPSIELKLVEELIAAGRTEGIQYRGKPKLLYPSELRQSKEEKRRNKGRHTQMKLAYNLKGEDVDNEIIKKWKEHVKPTVPLSKRAGRVRPVSSWMSQRANSPALGFYFPILEGAWHFQMPFRFYFPIHQ